MVFTLTVEDYIMHNKSYFEKGGFFESELARRTESFGNITHVWSTFESRLGSAGADPYTRDLQRAAAQGRRAVVGAQLQLGHGASGQPAPREVPGDPR